MTSGDPGVLKKVKTNPRPTSEAYVDISIDPQTKTEEFEVVQSTSQEFERV